METPLSVFISSVIAGMAAEREAAQAAIRAIPLSRPWVFEHSPASSLPMAESYLSKVRDCDVFVLLLGDKVTDPVRTEVHTAQGAGKPLLVFLSATAPPDVAAYARSLGVKYAAFRDSADLAAQVAEAVGDELITGYRRHQVPRADLASVAAFLDRVAQGGMRIDTGGGAFVGGDVSARLFVGRDLVINPETDPPEELMRAYYRSVADECCRLPLGVIDTQFVRTSGEQQIPLPDIYVDLDVVAPAMEGKGDERAWSLRLARGEGRDRTPLLEALGEPAAARAVLLGDAGSGKTTFVDYLTYLLATGSAAAPQPLRGLLPVRLVLREVVARHLPVGANKGTAEMLWNALAGDITARLGATGALRLMAHLQGRLLKEGGLILLDGLDEVPAAGARRKVLLEAVRALVAELPRADTHMLVTARPYAYAEKAWRLPDFSVLALAPFDEAQVDRFIERWYQAVRPSIGWNVDTARARSERLRAALDERPYLADLASRPLLLTLMATLHSSWGQLPEDRAGLYEETVKLLLGRWQRAREVRRLDGELEVEPAITQALGVGEERIRAALEALAFTVHDRQRGTPERDAGPADITEAEVLLAFGPLLEQAGPEALLSYLRDRAGLVVARREGVYAFPHRSFQEYLAACHLARQPGFAVELRRLACTDPAWWREVCVLGAGKAKQGGLGYAVSVVNALIPEGPEEVAEACAEHWRLAALAGQALVELRPGEEEAAQPDYAALLRRARRWLVRLVEEGQLPARERAEAGDVLGRLGDPRPGVATARAGTARHPDFLWVEIPAGSFTMGSAEGDDMAYGDEHPAHELTLPAFYISRYPVTNAQYGLFVEEGGYEDPDLWTPAGWAWRQGAEADLSPIDDGDLRKSYAEWLASRPQERRNRPYWWGDPSRAAPTRPVVGVSWYETLAYCRWLQAQFRRGRLPFRVWIDGKPRSEEVDLGGIEVRLPSEAEWEKAARGPEGNRWPWGNTWREGLANTDEAGLGQTSAVGIFPGGASRPYGLLDMAGNVWEWTRSRWGGRSVYRPDYGYPYDPGDGREVLDGPDLRVVRGGSWLYGQGSARCAVRLRLVPDHFDSDLGFRVVVSITLSSRPVDPAIHGCGTKPKKMIAQLGPGCARFSA